MTEIPTSVIVVSRDRPAALQRCLDGIEQLYYDDFELIVVSDGAGCDAVEAMGLTKAVKLVRFDDANISAARNAGLAQAAGDVVAFIDDDAVPEPTWLSHLIPPFADPDVCAAGGFVRGRNGISFQHKGRRVDGTGRHTRLDVAGGVQVFDGAPGNAIKTEGTNCAFRTDVLRSLGGFDPNFYFFLDETDVNLRLAEAGVKTAVVPLAEVHHGFHASAYRAANRMPTDLFEIGASQAYFLRKHSTPEQATAAELAFLDEQRRRLVRHMVAGNCEPRDVKRLMSGLFRGLAAGHARAISRLDPVAPRPSAFLRFVGRITYSGESAVLCGRPMSAGKLTEQARGLTASGTRVSLYFFDATARFHRVSFRNGLWVQSGGLFGKSEREEPLFRMWRRRDRLVREKSRVASARQR